jgi:hypothetical protein
MYDKYQCRANPKRTVKEKPGGNEAENEKRVFTKQWKAKN